MPFDVDHRAHGSQEATTKDPIIEHESTAVISQPERGPCESSLVEASLTENSQAASDARTTTACLETESSQTGASISSSLPKSTQAGSRDSNVAHAARSLKRTSSGVRLSLTSQGSAKILQEDEASPTPPSSPPEPDPFFGGSVDARNASKPIPLQLPRRMPSGRSRDSRAWEFWCDDEARNDLVKKANQESTGSAADAIHMMRSNKRKVLAPLQNHRRLSDNPGSSQHGRPHTKTNARPAQMARSKSAIAQPSSNQSTSFKLYEDGESHNPKKSRKNGTFHSSGSDSDKENQDPNAYAGSAIRQADESRQKHRRRPALKTSQTAPTLSLSSGRPKGTTMFQRYDPEQDEDVRSFMRPANESRAVASSHTTTSTREDDLDCIQGLLSLSQGRWR